jgi:phosphatidate cytidylyltransferase
LFGLLLAGCALIAIFAGGAVFTALVALLSFAAAREWHRLVGGPRYALPALATCIAVAAALLCSVLATASLWPVWTLVFGSVMAAGLAKLMGAPPLWNGAGAIYIGLPALSLAALRVHASHGIAAILLVFFTVWIADTGALAAGRFIGGPRLVPRLSPNKTWAGFLAGTLLPVVIIVPLIGFRGGSVGEATFLVLVLALAGHAGDLFESWVKRQMGCKDSGGLIPGHGGVLDRLDSTLFAAPLAAVLVFAFGLDPLCGGHP